MKKLSVWNKIRPASAGIYGAVALFLIVCSLLIASLEMTGAAISAAVLAALCALLYYDFRFRKHWTGYTFGYPLEGFDGQIFFTFDDGPSAYGKVLKTDCDRDGPISDPEIRKAVFREMPEYDFSLTATENLLALLGRHHIKAIFFLWGESIENNPHAPAAMRRMVAERHVIGNHSFAHLYSTRETVAKVFEDFAKNHRLIASVAGSGATLFRPPHGDWEPDLTKRFLAHPALRNYSFPLFWTNLFREWALTSSAELSHLEERLKGFRESCRDGKGKIILLHDIYIPAILLTSMLIEEIGKLGYRVGDPDALVQFAAREANFFRLSPFGYYLRNLKARILLKFSFRPAQHTNYRMDQ